MSLICVARSSSLRHTSTHGHAASLNSPARAKSLQQSTAADFHSEDDEEREYEDEADSLGGAKSARGLSAHQSSKAGRRKKKVGTFCRDFSLFNAAEEEFSLVSFFIPFRFHMLPLLRLLKAAKVALSAEKNGLISEAVCS